jgi:hypothetical protein
MAEGAELLAESEILEGELGTGPESRAERSEEAQEEDEHAGMLHNGTRVPPSLRVRGAPTGNQASG